MKNQPVVFWLANHSTAITLSRKKLIPPYFAQLWAKTHSGITPFWWMILDYVATQIWGVIGLGIIFGGLNVMVKFHLVKSEYVGSATNIWMGLVILMFLVSYEYLPIFKKLEENWRAFNRHFKHLARVFYSAEVFPPTVEEFVDKVDEALVAIAYGEFQRKDRWSQQDNSAMRDLYDAAKAFGILKTDGSGYGPYFDRARKKLNKEELPLFHR